MGNISLDVTQKDLESLKYILEDGFMHKPNMVTHVYKNRRGRYKGVKIWSYVNLGTLRVEDLFMTDNNYNLIPVQKTHVKQEKIEDIKDYTPQAEIRF